MSSFRKITDEWYTSAKSTISGIDNEFNNWRDAKANLTRTQFDYIKSLIERDIKGQADLLASRIVELGNQYQIVFDLIGKNYEL